MDASGASPPAVRVDVGFYGVVGGGDAVDVGDGEGQPDRWKSDREGIPKSWLQSGFHHGVAINADGHAGARVAVSGAAVCIELIGRVGDRGGVAGDQVKGVGIRGCT